MKKADRWKIFSDKNPSFNGEGNVTMSAAGLRKLFDQTYEQGYEQGKANVIAIQKLAQGAPATESIFDKLFGKH